MKTALVGYTGFVGGNLAAKHKFDGLYNSQNIETAFGTHPDLLVYSGVPAEKFLANTAPDKDMQIINNAIENIKKIGAKAVVLISTADVYKIPNNVTEQTKIDTMDLQAYGLNRYYLEKWVSENVQNHLIIRLPGLFGKGIKKNFLYDMLTIIPSMLTYSKYSELCEKSDIIQKSYVVLNEKFYKLAPIAPYEKDMLKTFFEQNDFNALSFTDSRATYQFYNLGNLWSDIGIAMQNNIKLLNLTSEPVTASEVYAFLTGGNFVNNITEVPVFYNIKTNHFGAFGGIKGYIKTKKQILEEIKQNFDTRFENV